jgi:hypothetical protein
MDVNAEEQDLRDRLKLIESMMAEGRRSTESWGWVFILWGVAYYIAIAWSTWSFGGVLWGHDTLAWPVTMIAAFVLTIVLVKRRHGNGNHPQTTVGRALSAIWMAMGISMFVLLLSLGLSGRGGQQASIAVVAAMLGTANAASSMILKWKAQLACAIVWWAAAVASCFASVTQSTIVFTVAIFFCQIVFGAYGMMAEARERQQDARHA